MNQLVRLELIHPKGLPQSELNSQVSFIVLFVIFSVFYFFYFFFHIVYYNLAKEIVFVDTTLFARVTYTHPK